MKSARTYTSKSLLDLVLDFLAIAPKPSDWEETAIESNPPQYHRLRKIHALLSAFELRFDQAQRPSDADTTVMTEGRTFSFTERLAKMTPLDFFISGHFISQRPLEAYALFIDRAFSRSDRLPPQLKDKPVVHRDLQAAFERMFAYRRNLDRIFRFNSGILEASGKGLLYSIHRTNEMSARIRGLSSPFDKDLLLLADPASRKFEETELVERFQFDRTDLYELDMEWM